jgi:glycosyltransferase involved in cell wall biosynthesis
MSKGYEHNDISVVIPCYNQSEYVQDAIQSVLANSVRPKSIYVLLMDETSWALRTQLEALSPIVLCSISNQMSLPAARNTLIKRVTTPYVIPLDADDKLPPNFIQQVIRLLPADVVYVKCFTFGDFEKVWDSPKNVSMDWLKERNYIPNTALIKIDAWREAGGYNETFTFGYEDWEFWINLCRRQKVFKKCTTTHLLYRKHGHTLAADAASRREEIVQMLQALYPDVFTPPVIEVPKPSPIIRRRREEMSPIITLPILEPEIPTHIPPSTIAAPISVSVIIPCYGYSNYVENAVKSVVKQTRPADEIIILLMDGDSQLLKSSLEALGKNVRAICSTQKLLPSARNVLVGISSSTHFIPLDADDQLPDTFVERVTQYANQADVVYVGSKYFGAIKGTWPPDITEEVNWELLTTFRRNAFVCTALVKKSAWADVGGYNDKLTAYEDMEFWLHLHNTGHSFIKCNSTFLEYRKHSQTSMLQEHNGNATKLRGLQNTIMNIHAEQYTHIPKIVHYVWMGSKKRPQEFIDTWKRVLGDGWIFKEWNENSFDIDSFRFLRQAYDAKKFGIAVDPIRATVLYQFGGIWLDTDVKMTRDISPFLQYDFFASYESESWLNVGTLGARPGLSIFKSLIDMYHTVNLPETSDEFVERIGTGPITITKELQRNITSWVPDGRPTTLIHNGHRYRLESPAVFVLDDEKNGAQNFTQHLYNASWMDAPVSRWAEIVRSGYEEWKCRMGINKWRG